MEGGSWNFTCDHQSNNQGFPRTIYIGTGKYTWSTPWANDSTICLIPGLTGIGIRYYTSSGNAKVCNSTVPYGGGEIIKFDNGTILSGTASYAPFAELIRISNINAGSHVFLSTMPLTSKLRSAINSYSVSSYIFSLVFTNTTLIAHQCKMAKFNKIIDFGTHSLPLKWHNSTLLNCAFIFACASKVFAVCCADNGMKNTACWFSIITLSGP